MFYICFLFHSTKMSVESEHERIAQVTHQKWAIACFFEEIAVLLIFLQNRAIPSENRCTNSQPCNLLFFCSGHSPNINKLLVFLRELLICSFAKTERFPQKADERIPSPAICLFLVSYLNKSICTNQSIKQRKWANH